MNNMLFGFADQKNQGWGYDTTRMIFDSIASGAVFESFANSSLDIATINNVGAMAMTWEMRDFAKPLPPP